MPEGMMKEAVASTVHALKLESSGNYGEHPTDGRVEEGALQAILNAWPEMPRKVADKMKQQYGLPNEATQSRLIWFNNGPWKRTILYRDEVPHDFPKPHTDVLEQFIDYRVPIEKFDDLAEFDGSVIAERTKGELSARCDAEPANFLALNLAHEIVTGRRTIEEARSVYVEKITGFFSGESSPEVEGLMFDLPSGGTNDPDSVATGPMISELLDQARSMMAGNGNP